MLVFFFICTIVGFINISSLSLDRRSCVWHFTFESSSPVGQELKMNNRRSDMIITEKVTLHLS